MTSHETRTDEEEYERDQHKRKKEIKESGALN